jgi:hypothetical protein
MPLDPRLENYLSSLDRALTSIPVSDRADIVTEIKSHVLTAMEREPKPAIDSVLAALGEPEIVANHYLMERGLKPGKPPISPIVKWLVVGFLGTCAMLLVFIALILHSVGPAIRISDKDDRVTLFGGLIDIDGKKGTVKIGDSFIDGGEGGNDFQGQSMLSNGDKVAVLFGNGKVSATTAKDKFFIWDCHGRYDDNASPKMTEKAGKKTLDLSEIGQLHCDLNVPQGADVQLQGSNGKILVEKPRFNLDASLNNGRVNVMPDDATRYAFDFNVGNGRADSRAPDTNPEFHLHVQVNNGRISIVEKE